MPSTTETKHASSRKDNRGHNAAKRPGEKGWQPRRLAETGTPMTHINHAARDEFASAHNGILRMNVIERETLETLVTADLIEVMESLPANTPDFPGPLNASNKDIALSALLHHAGLGEGDSVDWEGSTGSWGTRAPGEGAVYFEAVLSDEDGEEYETVRGTMTWDELDRGDLPVERHLDSDLTTWTFDVDFKRMLEEKEDAPAGESYLDVLEEVAHARRIAGHTDDVYATMRENNLYGNYAEREFVSWVIKDQYKNPVIDPRDEDKWRDAVFARYCDAHSGPFGGMTDDYFRGPDAAAAQRERMQVWFDKVLPSMRVTMRRIYDGEEPRIR